MKIFKLFVCIALILSISLINSFAAISVSDGSAFVTKAEFAADLNNLSNRMSSLENSLDAKIDSLVSSYLSRNGIWNGEKQVKSASTISLGTGFTVKDNFNDTMTPLAINQKLATLSKSGLVRFNVSSSQRIYAYAAINRSVVKSNFSIGYFAVSLFFNNKQISGLTVESWYGASEMSKVFSSNLTSWKFADMMEVSFYNNSSSDQVAAGITRPAFQEYIYFFAEKNDDIYANVIGIGSLFGHAMKGVKCNWDGKKTLSYELSVY